MLLNKVKWNKFKKDKLAFFSLFFIISFALISTFLFLFIPDKTPYANDMHVELATLKPGTSVYFLDILDGNKSEIFSIKHVFFGKKRTHKRIPIISYSEEINGIKYIKYIDELEYKHHGKYRVSKRLFLLGTDKYGRDMLSRILYGARISLSVGLVAVLISLLIGLTLGLFAGYYQGIIDNLVMWFVNVVWSIPTLLMVIALTLALGKGFWQVFIAIGFTMWVEVARIVRGQVISIKQNSYVEASKSLGYRSTRIIFRHILPNITGPLIVISAANFSAAILIESGRSFLGIGAQPPRSSWGGMIRDHYYFIIMDKSYLAIVPGIAIMSFVLSFVFIGNGLRNAFDVKN